MKRLLFAGILLLSPSVAEAHPPRLEVQAVAQTGSMPKGVSISPDGKRAYVTNFGQANGKNIDIFDAATLSYEATIDVPGIVVESVLSNDGKTIYASNFQRNSVQFVDLEKRRVVREITVGMHPKILVQSTDSKFLFAANWSGNSVTQIDIASGKVARTLPVGLNPRGMAMTKSGVLYVANFNGESIDIFKGPELADKHRIKACPIPRHLALSPDEKTLFISCFHDSMIHALDVATEKVVHEVVIGSSPKSLEVSRDGRFVWSADYGKETNSVSVIDTDDWTARVYRVPGMDHGSGLSLFADGRRALVTGWWDSHVYIVGFEGTGPDPKIARTKIEGGSIVPSTTKIHFMSRVPLWLVALAIALAAPRALASNEADALFAEGRDLMEKGRFAEACPKLQRSEELSPAVGTLINLGFCWEQLGRMRSAMEAYAEAEILARAAKDDKRAGIAHERFVGVEGKVMKLVLRVADEQIPGLGVTRNGTPVPKTDWGKPIPVDPDDIVVVASAPGRISWRGVVQGKGDGAAITVIVPQLEEIKEAPAPREILSQRRFIALGLAGGALVTLGAGTALGLGAKSRHDDAAPHCDPSGCDETGAAIQSGAATQGNVATVLFLVGLALGGASAYLWLTGAPEPRNTGRIDVGPTGFGGTF